MLAPHWCHLTELIQHYKILSTNGPKMLGNIGLCWYRLNNLHPIPQKLLVAFFLFNRNEMFSYAKHVVGTGMWTAPTVTGAKKREPRAYHVKSPCCGVLRATRTGYKGVQTAAGDWLDVETKRSHRLDVKTTAGGWLALQAVAMIDVWLYFSKFRSAQVIEVDSKTLPF